MQAAVYHGVNDVRLETVPVPQIGAGELLVRVHSCGICGTDLKKIATGSHSAPRIFGHETAGTDCRHRRRRYQLQGRRPCHGLPPHPLPRLLLLPAQSIRTMPDVQEGRSDRRLRAQRWRLFRVRSRDGLDRPDGGVVRIPDGVSFEQASYIEPVNTCMKGIETLGLQPGETVLVIGQGPIGIILAVLAQRQGRG